MGRSRTVQLQWIRYKSYSMKLENFGKRLNVSFTHISRVLYVSLSQSDLFSSFFLCRAPIRAVGLALKVRLPEYIQRNYRQDCSFPHVGLISPSSTHFGFSFPLARAKLRPINFTLTSYIFSKLCLTIAEKWMRKTTLENNCPLCRPSIKLTTANIPCDWGVRDKNLNQD